MEADLTRPLCRRGIVIENLGSLPGRNSGAVEAGATWPFELGFLDELFRVARPFQESI